MSTEPLLLEMSEIPKSEVTTAQQPRTLWQQTKALMKHVKLRTIFGVFSTLVNLVVIILLVVWVHPYKNEVAVLQQQLSDLQSDLKFFDMIRFLSNVSQVQGATSVLQAQVATTAAQAAIAKQQADTTASTLISLNGTVTALSAMVDHGFGLNSSAGACFILPGDEFVRPGYVSRATLGVDLIVINPNTTVALNCWSSTSPSRATPWFISVVTDNAALLQTVLDEGQHIEFQSQKQTGVFNISQIRIVSQGHVDCFCTSFCVNIQY